MEKFKANLEIFHSYPFIEQVLNNNTDYLNNDDLNVS